MLLPSPGCPVPNLIKRYSCPQVTLQMCPHQASCQKRQVRHTGSRTDLWRGHRSDSLTSPCYCCSLDSDDGSGACSSVRHDLNLQSSSAVNAGLTHHFTLLLCFILLSIRRNVCDKLMINRNIPLKAAWQPCRFHCYCYSLLTMTCIYHLNLDAALYTLHCTVFYCVLSSGNTTQINLGL